MREENTVEEKLYLAGLEDAMMGWASDAREYSDNEYYAEGHCDGLELKQEHEDD